MGQIQVIERFQIVESLVWHGKPEWLKARINLFVSGEQWGYCLTVRARTWGVSYGPLLRFCKLYSTRQQAIDMAVAEIVGRARDGGLIEWARSLTEPRQLRLFQ